MCKAARRGDRSGCNRPMRLFAFVRGAACSTAGSCRGSFAEVNTQDLPRSRSGWQLVLEGRRLAAAASYVRRCFFRAAAEEVCAERRRLFRRLAFPAEEFDSGCSAVRGIVGAPATGERACSLGRGGAEASDAK